tara:strand:- start:683 stop:910 length:228 start_codon:yes stop_codon:yes gene_type:complete
MNKLRMWLVGKLLGDKPYINNVTFYQTVCLDIDCGITISGGGVELGHDIPWKNSKDGIGFYFDLYKKAVDEKKAN